MDAKPFFKFNILSFEGYQINELKKFTKPAFSLENILATARTLKYVGAVKKILEEELKSPSEEFTRFLHHKFMTVILRALKVDQFKKIVKEVRDQFVNELINERLKLALANEAETSISSEKIETAFMVKPRIEATQDEKDGYNIVKATLRGVVRY